ncbi:MAG: Sua5 YciO YrdC YwlC family protein [Epsilonproteobacteria bacterium]|nr:Sua5 YciO YrdC YwlC family protein [Campylobacterota bacterium]
MDGNLVYFIQTDTVAGFVSKNEEKLRKIKGRPLKKPFLLNACDLNVLKDLARVPKRFRKRVRREKKSTFVYENGKAVRVVFDEEFYRFLKRFGWLYSTSANRSGEEFDIKFALEKADIIVRDKRGFSHSSPSRIYKISNDRIKKLR